MKNLRYCDDIILIKAFVGLLGSLLYWTIIFTLRRTPILWTLAMLSMRVGPQCLLSESWRPTCTSSRWVVMLHWIKIFTLRQTQLLWMLAMLRIHAVVFGALNVYSANHSDPLTLYRVFTLKTQASRFQGLLILASMGIWLNSIWFWLGIEYMDPTQKILLVITKLHQCLWNGNYKI